MIGSTSGTRITVRGDDVRRRDRRARHAGPAQRRLQDGLLLQHARLADQQGLLAGSDLRLGAHHFDLRQRSHFHLLAIVLQQLLRRGQRVAPTWTASLNDTRSQYSSITAATVVSTCSLKVRSLTSRLFLAIRICRELSDRARSPAAGAG